MNSLLLFSWCDDGSNVGGCGLVRSGREDRLEDETKRAEYDHYDEDDEAQPKRVKTSH
jgi:hypothetical protein